MTTTTQGTEVRNQKPGRHDFHLATQEDNAELLRFSRNAAMPGAIRFSFDRAPVYLAALCVEGRRSEALICRDAKTGRLVATGHRAVKPAFVNGRIVSVGYLSGLRVDPAVRSGQLLSQGYAHLRALDGNDPAQFYLTTIMEDNSQAKGVLLSGRFGLPAYHDFGRFCCIAASLQGRRACRRAPGFSVRRATAADAASVVNFLNHEGRSKQFFPEYRVEDFGRKEGLLSHLEWEDILLAYQGRDLAGLLAAWDQRAFRRWRVMGYAPWLNLLRIPLNIVAKLRHLPPLPRPDSALDYFILSLVCIRDNDPAVFKGLLEEMIRSEARTSNHAFFLAGLHERDPLLPELLKLPHIPLYSRLYVVSWDDNAVQELDRERVPYLELGSL